MKNEEIRKQLAQMLQSLNTIQAHLEQFAESAQQLVDLVEAEVGDD